MNTARWKPGDTLRRLGAATLVVFVAVFGLDRPLHIASSPRGIVDLQLAFSPETAIRIVDGWSVNQRLLCAFTLGVDVLFLLLYATTLALACAAVGERWRQRRPVLGAAGRVFAGLAVVAGGADLVEDVASLLVLRGDFSVAPVVSVAAVVKFSALLLAAGYAGVAAIATRASN